jgi:hypothetical protein
VQDDAPLSGRGLLCRKSVSSALLHFCGKVAQGLLPDDAAFASGKGGFSLIDGNANFRAGALTFFPQGEGFLDRIFFAVKPSALNSLTDKRLLVRCELYFHRLYGTEKLRFRQVASWTRRRQLLCVKSSRVAHTSRRFLSGCVRQTNLSPSAFRACPIRCAQGKL